MPSNLRKYGLLFFSRSVIVHLEEMHDAHEILSAFQSIGKLGSIDERLEVLHASLVLASDEQFRLCQRPLPIRRVKRQPFRVRLSKNRNTNDGFIIQELPDVVLAPHSENDSSGRTAAIYNAVPFHRTKKLAEAKSHELMTHDRGTVNRFRQHMLASQSMSN